MKISKDKKTIKLDVPIGSKLYQFHTDCNDMCTYCEKEFREKFHDACCSGESVCHTKAYNVKAFRLSLDNIGHVMDEWHKTIFETKKAAKKAMNKKIKKNRKAITAAGFELNKEGDYVGPKSVQDVPCK